MNEISNWKDITLNTLSDIGNRVLSVLPKLIGAVLVLLIGWAISKVIIILIKRILKLPQIERFSSKLSEQRFFGNINMKFGISKTILLFVKWALFLTALIIAADIMDWDFVSNEIGNLLRYLPQLFSALLVFFLGLYLARFVRKTVTGFYGSLDLGGAKAIGGILFYVIAIVTSVTALDQAGIDTTVLTNNVTLILGAFLLTVAISIGLGSKKIVESLLQSHYSRKNYEIGDKIEFNGMSGTIERIDNISLVLKTEKGKVVIPIKEIVENQVTLINDRT
ncbi:mechanosensitive ion channel family protein [Sediminicola luteus]|uniref:Mechanosensitive ion channel MscS domain-containing protein n=1 Tax=Sediminicola luteus TaxID=319238 RepID=A0A2A4G4S5_9FLAO|nr:mechanosensitive ion channel domain-containing protein [Sediminicola luteus]PCE62986.1 hypothetical protein B7P33_17065 [Sediminicola luteus]